VRKRLVVPASLAVLMGSNCLLECHQPPGACDLDAGDPCYPDGGWPCPTHLNGCDITVRAADGGIAYDSDGMPECVC
jgi:hypothetical protein